jgi:Flp pilus assembly protein TadG
MPMKDCTPLNSRGQSMTEVAFLLPVLLLLILGAVDVAQVLSAQQHLEQAAYVAALRLRTTPSLGTDATRLANVIQTKSGLAVTPSDVGATYNIGGDGADQVVVTATYRYPLLLPGLGKLLTGLSGSGQWTLTVSRASIAATDPPTVTVPTTGTVQVIPPSGTTVPSGPTPLTLTCTLYQDGTPVPTAQPCAQATPVTFYPPAVATAYTATVMQVNGVTSPPSTQVPGP